MFLLKCVSYSYDDDYSTKSGGIEVEDLAIENGAVTAIIGPSGSGKTTLLSILAGFLQPKVALDGVFSFDGEPIAASGHPSGRVGFVFQAPMLLGTANGITNALQGHFAKPDSELLPIDQVQYYTKKLNLFRPDRPSLLAKRARLLSGGEAQRMSILRALLADPEIILCDEPTSSLDERNARLAMETLREWSGNRGRPVVWVTHNLDQAAEYADHYIFVSKGAIYHPNQVDTDALNSEDREKRLVALRRINAKLGGEIAELDDAADQSTTDTIVPKVGLGTFSRWLANGISTDGVGIDKAETRQPMLIADAPMRDTLIAIEGREAPYRKSLVGRIWQRVRYYSRYSAGLILALMLLQMFVASVLGVAARNYAQERLNDPSVARLVFELFVENQAKEEIEEMQLFPQRLRDLETMIEKALPVDTTLDRPVQIYVRRTLSSSRIKFDTPNANCNVWRPMETNVLNRHDPLVTQAVLAENIPNLTHEMESLLSRASERARSLASGNETTVPAVAMIDRRFVDVLVTHCGVDTSKGPILVMWDTGLNRTIPLELVAAWDERPPLYPGSPEMIVFEDEYQAAMQLLDGRKPDAPRVATAYFPISSFGMVDRVLANEGYRIRDDSASAVESLQKIESVAVTAPRLVAIFALSVSVVVIGITISSVLEINKRVLALFIALRMRRLTLISVFMRHLAPALIFAAFVAPTMAALLAAMTISRFGWTLDAAFDPVQIAKAYGKSLGALVAVTLCASMAVILAWWAHTSRRLKTYLQE